MADPDTIDEAFGDESDELVDDLGGLNDGEMETLEEGSAPSASASGRDRDEGARRGLSGERTLLLSPAPSIIPQRRLAGGEAVRRGKGAMSQKRL